MVGGIHCTWLQPYIGENLPDPRNWLVRVSAIGALSVFGVLGCHMVEGSVNADTFEEFIEKFLLPNLCPFNSTNPHSVVVMDNCSIHHAESVIKLIELEYW